MESIHDPSPTITAAINLSRADRTLSVPVVLVTDSSNKKLPAPSLTPSVTWQRSTNYQLQWFTARVLLDDKCTGAFLQLGGAWCSKYLVFDFSFPSDSYYY